VPTLADWQLYTTLVRFDPVYYSRFKLNLRYLRGFPNLQVGFSLRFTILGFAEISNFTELVVTNLDPCKR